MKYLIRSLKYLVYFVILFLIIITITGLLTTPDGEAFSYASLLKEGSLPKLVVFFVVFAAIYPFLGFTKRKLYLNGDFTEYRQIVVETMENAGFVFEDEQDGQISFRQASNMRRFSRMYEDRVTFFTNENPVLVDGYRKDVDRLVRTIEYRIRQQPQD